jgi:hypothetical protein
MRSYLWTLSVGALVMLWSSAAGAQFKGDTLRIFALGELGLGGTLSGEGDLEGFEVDMDPSFGFVAGADYGLHTFFAIGAMGRWLSYKPKTDFQIPGVPVSVDVQVDRSSLIDLSLYPRIRLPLPIVEVYAMLPVGLSFSSPAEGDGETGYNVGLYGGAQLGLLPLLSLVAQLGWSRHSFPSASFNELTINAGLALGL